MQFAIKDLKDNHSVRAELLRLNNENARETSLLTRERLDGMIASARVATAVEPGIAFLLGFEQSDNYDGGHFLWFRERLDRFLYIDRIVVSQSQRRLGLGRLLYEDLFERAQLLGHTNIACEVNVRPPNPTSDAFHAALGFTEIGTQRSTMAPRRCGISCAASERRECGPLSICRSIDPVADHLPRQTVFCPVQQ
jgi:predicted GNAT superfamily acetyltransferase